MTTLSLGEIPSESPRIYSSVHPQETPVTANNATPCVVNADHPPSLSTSFIHSGWLPLRQRTYDALKAAKFSWNSLDCFAGCADSAWVLQEVERPACYKIVRDYCHNRWCRVCSAKRGHVIQRNLAALIAHKEIRLLTLTVQSTNQTLSDCLLKLYRGFRRLRASAIWKERVDGGIFVTEIKWSERSGVWHPHLHCIIEGRFLPHADIKRNWLRATGDSSIVDIRPIRDKAGAAGYVTKYLSKPCDASVSDDPERFAEAVTALKGRRLCGAYGGWKSAKLTENKPERATRKVGHINELRLQASDGDENAKRFMKEWNSFRPDEVSREFTIDPTIRKAEHKESGP